MVSILSNAGSQVDGLLSIGRRLAPPGAPGMSARSRQLTQSFLSQSSAGANQLFSSTSSGAYLSIEDLQTMIKGLRARVPQSQIADSLKGDDVKEADALTPAEDGSEDSRVLSADEMLANLRRGSVVNTEA